MDIKQSDNEQYCDICGRICDGVHSNKKYNKEIQKIINVIESYDEKVVDESNQ